MDELEEKSANPVLINAAQPSGSMQLTDEQVEAASRPLLTAPDQGPVIEFDDVSFEYIEGEPVIHGVTFSASKGQKVALVGESGGGKSTLVNLLLGLYSPPRDPCECVVRNSPIPQLRNCAAL